MCFYLSALPVDRVFLSNMSSSVVGIFKKFKKFQFPEIAVNSLSSSSPMISKE